MPAVVIYKAEPKAVNSDDNVICHRDDPSLAFAVYRGQTYSFATWQRETGRDLKSTSDCDQERHTD